jgi:hypothetical protein
MIESKFDHLNYTRPDEAARTWVFVAVAGDNDPKYLSWTKTKFKNMDFVWRNFGYSPDLIIDDPITKEKDLQINILKKYTKHPDYGVIFQVLNSKGGQHWIAGVGKAFTA